MKIEQAKSTIIPPCEIAIARSQGRWDSIAKPLNSLGKLESVITRIAGIQRTADIDISSRCVVVMCADNGVVAQGVTQTDSSVTGIMAENFTKGTTTVCTMARYINADVVPVDIGIDHPVSIDGLLNRNVMLGTHDFTKGAAMSHKQAIEAIEVGINTAEMLKSNGYSLIITGEMGIGNTTTSSALASVLLELPAEKVTGRGAGLDNSGLTRKIAAIKKAVEINSPKKDDPIDLLSKLGGLDIAGMAGLFIGGAVFKIPVLIDGFISAVSAAIAIEVCPPCRDYMIPTHMSAEPAGKAMLEHIGFSPLVTAGMCLGEGTGAAATLTLIDMAVHVYKNAVTFSDACVEKYEHFENQDSSKKA